MAKLFLYPPTPLDKTGLATEAKQDVQITELQSINSNIQDLEINTDGLEALLTTTNSELGLIKTATDEIELKLDSSITQLTAISTNTDGIEGTLTAIAGYVDQIESAQTTAQNTLTSIDNSLTNVDTSLNNVEAGVDSVNAKLGSSLVTEKHDYVSLTYVGASTDIQTVTYKDGGVAGTTVATLTLGYDGSNRLTSVTKS